VDLLSTVFHDIDDTYLLSERKSEESALGRLIQEYGEHAKRIDHLPDMRDDSLGRDLKAAIALMAPEDQIKLSYHYYINEGILENDAEDIRLREDRQLKHWTVKASVYLIIGLVSVLAGATIAYTFKRGAGHNDDPVIGGLLTTAAAIAKILLSVGD